ncbi:MAG: hypothetical protein KA712_20920 [Myxococcales bacterium]|nr:hypothetical protein [Myxococcales bacterium]
MKLTNTIALLGAFVAFVINPNFGCVSGAGHDFGQEEMQDMVVGTWKLRGEGFAMTFALRPALGPTERAAAPTPFIRGAYACDNRDFYQSASACIDVSTFHLEGELLTSDVEFASNDLKGTFRILGQRVIPGELELMLPDGSWISVPSLDSGSAPVNGTWWRQVHAPADRDRSDRTIVIAGIGHHDHLDRCSRSAGSAIMIT